MGSIARLSGTSGKRTLCGNRRSGDFTVPQFNYGQPLERNRGFARFRVAQLPVIVQFLVTQRHGAGALRQQLVHSVLAALGVGRVGETTGHTLERVENGHLVPSIETLEKRGHCTLTGSGVRYRSARRSKRTFRIESLITRKESAMKAMLGILAFL